MKALVSRTSDWGPLMRARRRELGLTQHDVAARAGVTRQTVAKLERDASDTTLRTVLKVARSLDLGLLVTDEREREPIDLSDDPLRSVLASMSAATQDSLAQHP